jgi:transcriptional regulator with XRE-family HTH domain
MQQRKSPLREYRIGVLGEKTPAGVIERSGLSRAYISMLELGQRKPSSKALPKIAAGYKVTEVEIVKLLPDWPINPLGGTPFQHLRASVRLDRHLARRAERVAPLVGARDLSTFVNREIERRIEELEALS